MAKMSDNLIGYGAAQVFDTSRSVNAYKSALAKKEKDAKADDEKFLKSLSVDSKGVRAVDVPRFTEKYNEFMEWSAKNQVDLKNPSKNPAIFQQFQVKKNELLQDVAMSKQAQATHNTMSDTIFKGREEFYNSSNVKGANTLHETSIYDDGFQGALSFQPGRDTNAALAAVPVKDLHTETTYENEQGVKTKTFKIKEDALDNAVDLFYNQYQMEYENDFDTEKEARDFIKKNIKGRIKQDYQLTREGDGDFNLQFGSGGRVGKIAYDFEELDSQAATDLFADENLFTPIGRGKGPLLNPEGGQVSNLRKIDFSTGTSETKPITFRDKDGTDYKDVIPQSFIIDNEGNQYMSFYKDAKALTISEKETLISNKRSELILDNISPEEATKQAEEAVNALDGNVMIFTDKIPKTQINTHYNFLYNTLEERGLFKGTAKPQQTEEEVETNNDPLGLNL